MVKRLALTKKLGDIKKKLRKKIQIETFSFANKKRKYLGKLPKVIPFFNYETVSYVHKYCKYLGEKNLKKSIFNVKTLSFDQKKRCY